MDLDVLLARILDFCQKGSRPDCQKTALTIFFSPQFKHFYSGLSMFYLIEIIIFQISEGVQHFFFFLGGGGGVQHFPGGSGVQVSLTKKSSDNVFYFF